ncbi:MAG TPA: hypothetical protein VGK32_18835 [Vicinamibacterales bacterium]
MLGALLYVGRWLMFWWDEWAFIFDRPDPTARSLLAPFFDTFVAVPVVVYQALLAAFGMRTYVPYLLVDWAAHFAIAFLLYRTVSRRSGVFLGLAAGISVIFLGSGFEVLLQPFQIQFQFAIVSGLLTIDQIDTGRRRVASIALVFGVASSGLGVIFAGLVALWGILRRDGATVLAAMPGIAVYAAWFFTWGRESGQLAGPRLGALDAGYSVVYGIGAALSGVIGLPPARFAIVGIALATAVLIGGGILARRGYRPDPLAVAAIAALAAEQVLRAIHRGQFGVEYGARSGYVYAGSIFVWLAISGLIGGRLSNRRAASILIAILIVPMVLGNMRQFAGAAVQHRTWRATELAELRLIESLRSDPRLALDVQPDDTRAIGITARSYLSAIDRFGRPTLEYDWQPFIDPAAVEAARRRLLPESP